MVTYYIQDLIHPYTGLINLKPTMLLDLDISDVDKEYLKQYLILNIFFHNFDDQWRNLGLAYYSVINYFTSNPDFIIVEDPTRDLYAKLLSFVNENFSNMQLKVPMLYPIPSDQLIIKSYDDAFNKDRITNTAVYLLLKYAKPNPRTITFDATQIQSVGFIGG